jgi:hypothetical protein
MKAVMRMQFMIMILIAFITAFTSGCDGEGNSSNAPGSTTAEPFDLDLALELGRLCLQAYQMLDDFKNDKNFQLPAPFTLEKVFCTTERFIGESIDTNSIEDKQFCTGKDEVPIAFIATSGEDIFLVFRGTKDIYEWIKDAEFLKEHYDFVPNAGNTEKGFTKVYRSIHNPILDELNSLADSTEKFTTLFVTGHSLGAALAILSIPELIDKTSFKQPIMYNFAGPRVGDKTFKKLYNSLIDTSWRVYNTRDEAPRFPPLRFNYIHVKTNMSITFGKDPIDPNRIEENHEMCNYYKHLCNMTSDPETCKEMAGGADGCKP